MGKIRTWTNDDLVKAVRNASSIRQVLTALNLKEAGGNYNTIRQHIKKLGIDSSHFMGQAWRKDSTIPPVAKKLLSEILTENSTYKSYHLRKRLINEGVFEAQCTGCGLKKWLNGPIPLELDHKNGQRTDNRVENLTLLCPNCHALTPTYRGRNIGKC